MLKNLFKIFTELVMSKNPAYRYAVKLKRNYRLAILNNKEDKVLDICGGINPLSKDYINVDVLDHPNVDIVSDLQYPLPFEDSEISKIISVATLEHFGILDINKILKEFNRILKTNGKLEIGVPSLDKILAYYSVHGCDEMVIRYLHGAQKDNQDIHLCILDFKRFKNELEKVGFVNIEELDYDFSLHDKIFMMKISANKK